MEGGCLCHRPGYSLDLSLELLIPETEGTVSGRSTNLYFTLNQARYFIAVIAFNNAQQPYEDRKPYSHFTDGRTEAWKSH